MTAAPIRCPAPHPTRRQWECRGVLTRAIPGTVEVRQTDEPVPPGCFELVCDRCGARYVACARAA